jgi:hypothetical protein
LDYKKEKPAPTLDSHPVNFAAIGFRPFRLFRLFFVIPMAANVSEAGFLASMFHFQEPPTHVTSRDHRGN